MSFWTLYWLSRLDGIKEFSIALAVVSGTCFVVMMFMWFFTKGPYMGQMEKKIHEGIPKTFYFIIPIFILSLLVSILTPTYKQALAFMGIDYVTHNERVIENTDKALDVFESYIDQKLNQMKEVEN